jgi:hypothetical protein
MKVERYRRELSKSHTTITGVRHEGVKVKKWVELRVADNANNPEFPEAEYRKETDELIADLVDGAQDIASKLLYLQEVWSKLDALLP